MMNMLMTWAYSQKLLALYNFKFQNFVLWALEFSKCQQLKNNLVVIKFVNILG